MKNKNFFKINLIYFTAMSCVAAVFVLGYMGKIKSDILSSFLIQIVVMFAIPMFMYSLLISKNNKQTLIDAGFKKISGKMIGLSIALGFVLYFINSFVADTFSSIVALLGYENLYGATTVTLSYKLLLKEFVLSAILPGFCEEFLHRGIMLFTNKKVNNPRYCLIISSILFGLMHLNINQFFYAAILGCLMGYIDLCADSIFPSMIIHFMNNFLSSYFFYGYYLNWPFARFVNDFSNVLRSNIFVFVISISSGVVLLFMCYKYLSRMMRRERAKSDVKKILNVLQKENLSYGELQTKINMANEILSSCQKDIFQTNDNKITESAENTNAQNSDVPNSENAVARSKVKSSFLDKAFLISSFVLGGLITIITFLWGMI